MKRIDELDTLRGLAALMVVNWHFFLMTYVIIASINSLIMSKPIYIFFAGSEAVVLFFVLSGFVMSFPFLNKTVVPYAGFLTRRFFRIYIPYLFWILITFSLSEAFDISTVKDLSTWFQAKWTVPVNPKILLEHIFLLGDFSTTTFNPVIWSLVHELRISIIFPLIMLLVIRNNWKVSIVVGLILYGIGRLNYFIPIQPSIGYNTSFFNTLEYTFMFILGAVAAKHMDTLNQRFQSLSVTYKVAFLLFSIILFTNSKFLPNFIKYFNVSLPARMDIFTEIWVALGSLMFIVTVISSSKMKRILSNRFLNLTGRMSYSLYLSHVPIFLSTIYLLHDKLPDFLVYVLSYILTFVVSYLSYKYIEIPSVSLGRRISTRKPDKINTLKIS
ncbi:acyltransferase family protein [Bacillus sp. B-jedd]|uniref:acyltransferase family protein n=1 Tax=Bacillus sp. B-jedd TaxID=1476857 RepID=UPI0005155ECC|nr:acyltransferase [Bacillus sp. B-jedd]CEG28072.1 acyltransferase [Bacillus sp. B-jedd]